MHGMGIQRAHFDIPGAHFTFVSLICNIFFSKTHVISLEYFFSNNLCFTIIDFLPQNVNHYEKLLFMFSPHSPCGKEEFSMTTNLDKVSGKTDFGNFSW